MSLIENEEASSRELSGVLAITRSIIRILGTIVALAIFFFFLLAGGFLYALFSPDREGYARSQAASRIQDLLLNLWDRVLPIANGILSIIAPVVIIALALLAIRLLSRTGSAHFDLARIITDLPSLVAVLIVITICLLPLAGLGVPEVLNNVALVVVGFYFGQHQRTARRAVVTADDEKE